MVGSIMTCKCTCHNKKSSKALEVVKAELNLRESGEEYNGDVDILLDKVQKILGDNKEYE
jgi:hypothetical protein